MTEAAFDTLARIAGATDALWEPRRACKLHCGTHIKAIWSRSAVFQLRQRYWDDGLLYLPPNRTAEGRQQTSRLLSELNAAGWLDVRASAGRPARVRLTLDGDRVIRRACGLPTLEASASLFRQLVKLSKSRDRRVRQWKRGGLVSELAFVRVAGVASYGDLKKGDIGDMLAFVAPWLAAGFIVSRETTYAHAYLSATDTGTAFFATLPKPTEPDWLKSWQREFDEAMEDDAAFERAKRLNDIMGDTFRRERAALLQATPANESELGDIALPATE